MPLAEHLDVGRGVAVAPQPEVQRAVVRQDPDDHRQVARQRHDRERLQQSRAHEVERLLRTGHVGDDQVEERLAVHDARREAHQRRRDVLGHAEQHLGADRLAPLLEIGGLRGDRLQALDRGPVVDRQVHEHRRDLVAERAALVVGAHRHRAQHTQLEVFGVVGAVQEQPPQAARHAGEHDVVDGAAETAADLLDLAQRDAHDREPAVPTGEGVERRAGRDRVARHHRAHRLRDLLGALDRPARAAQHRADRAHDLRRFRDALVQRVEQELRRARRGLRAPLGDDGRGVLGLEVEQQRRDVDARHTVDQRVVRLLQQRDVAAFDAFDQPDLPQRAVAVEQPFLDARGQRDELLPRSRPGQAVWRT